MCKRTTNSHSLGIILKNICNIYRDIYVCIYMIIYIKVGGEIAKLVRAGVSDPGDKGTNPSHCNNM